jgi:large subunit ribosomal protein L15
MQLHQARRADLSNKKKVRVGRGPGSGLGKTAGRGIKGATSRSGYAMMVTYEGGQMPLFRRLPKRGFRNGPFRENFSVVNLADLAEFAAGAKVGPEELRKAGLVRGARKLIKILGDGELKAALTVSADAFSKSALEKIQKAGGKAEWIGGAPKKEAPDFKKIEAEKKKKAAAEKPKPGAKDEAKGDAKGQAKAEGGAPGAGGKPEGGKPNKGGGGGGGKPGGEGGKPAGEGGGGGGGGGGKPSGEPKAPKAEKPAGEAPKGPEGNKQ